MPSTPKVACCLWFDSQGEEAARFYVSVFKNSKLGRITRYPDAGFEQHHKPAGSTMTVDFDLDGAHFTALNGGPGFKFNEAISLEVYCETQDEIDYYWDKLTADGGEPGPCGWLKDKFGVSWQIFPRMMIDLYDDESSDKAKRVMSAMMTMKKLDIAALQKAAEG